MRGSGSSCIPVRVASNVLGNEQLVAFDRPRRDGCSEQTRLSRGKKRPGCGREKLCWSAATLDGGHTATNKQQRFVRTKTRMPSVSPFQLSANVLSYFSASVKYITQNLSSGSLYSAIRQHRCGWHGGQIIKMTTWIYSAPTSCHRVPGTTAERDDIRFLWTIMAEQCLWTR